MSSQNQAAALALAGRGLRIFPCKPDKTPMVTAWEQNATCSPFAVSTKWASHPDALPAIPVGAHGLVVIDCDRKPGAPDGVQAFHDLCAAHGVDLSGAIIVDTPSGGKHFYWRTETPYGNSSGSLPAGIDVRGLGGYVIAPGAKLPDQRSYKLVQGSWDAIPALPDALAALLRPKVDSGASHTLQAPHSATERERAYAATALDDETGKLKAMRTGDGRNHALNVAAHSLGTMAGAGWIDRGTVAAALFDAATVNGHTAKHGERQTKATIESGINAGASKPREPLELDLPEMDLSELRCNGVLVFNPHRATASQSTPGKTAASSKRTVKILQCSAIQAKPIEWLWRGYLPLGKLALLAGAGGTGKSTIAFNFAGTVSNGGIWPDGSRCYIAGNVVIWSSEDDPADTIIPRLMAVGANLARCYIISGAEDENGLRSPFDAARDMDRLCEVVKQVGGAALLIIDPIVTAVTGDMHKANDVRRSLQAIVDFAAEMNCAVLGITHFAKGTAGKNSADRVIGSQAFSALARIVLVAAKEEDSQNRVFTRAKSNNSVDTGGYAYTIEAGTLPGGIETTRVVWGEALEGSSREILSTVEETDVEDTSKRTIAKRFLLETLSNGPVPSKELFEHARERHGISNDTLRRAQRDLGIEAIKQHFAGGWMWTLPLSEQMSASTQRIV